MARKSKKSRRRAGLWSRCKRLVRRRGKQLLVVALAALAIATVIYLKQRYFPAPPEIDSGYTVSGIDVSKHNGRVDMNKVAAAGHTFVFVKTSEGVSLKDATRSTHAANARKAGLKVGAYHYFIFKRDGEEQARNFLSAVQGMKLDLPLVIDVEKDSKLNRGYNATVKRNLKAMVDALRRAGHRSLMIYTNGDGYKNVYAGTYTDDTDMDLWLCSFRKPEQVAHRGHVIQQYDHHGKVAGIKGEIDLNVFCGSRDEWNEYLKHIKP